MADDASTARDRWEADAVDALRGESLDSLLTITDDGIEVKPLYTRDSSTPTVELGTPGSGSFRRGSTPTSTATGWQVFQRHDCLSEDVNRAILDDLGNGVMAITLANAADVDELDSVLDGLKLDLAPINLAPGTGREGSTALVELWDRRGHPARVVSGCLGHDSIAYLARLGSSTTALDDEVAEAATAAKAHASTHPLLRTFDVDGTAFGDAGASDAQEIAAVLSGGLRYLRAMIDAGMTTDDAAGQIRFTLSVGADQFGGIAKLRAARQCWARIVDACEGSPAAQGMHIHAITAWSMLSRRDRWVNMLRTTTACFAAAAGGADAITVRPFDDALGQPSELGLRIARNTQTILASESMIGAVVDPAGGSWYVEDLTSKVAERSWSLFQTVEETGGIGAL